MSTIYRPASSARPWGPIRRRAAAGCLVFVFGGALSWLAALPRPAAADFDASRLKLATPKIVAHKPRRQRDVGAGVVLAVKNGEILVLTAYHVIEEAEKIEVVFCERTYDSFPARIFPRISESLDAAVLIVEVERARQTLPELPTVDLGHAAKLEEGDRVYPLGHPLDLEWQISRDNTVESLTYEGDARQLRFTRGSIDRGNSGGPLFDRRGALVGTVTRMHPLHGVAVKADALLALVVEWHLPTDNLIPLPNPGSLIVATRPAGARVLLDGKVRGISRGGSLEIAEVGPGTHTVEVENPGYRPLRIEVEVAAGETRRIVAELSAEVTRSLFLVAVAGPPGGSDPGVDTAQATLLGRLTGSGYSVIDKAQADRILTSEGVMEALRGADPVRIAAIDLAHRAEVVVVGRLSSEAQPAVGRFFTGRAVLDLRCYRASTGEHLASGTLSVGGAEVPGKLGPSELVARTAASEAVAEMAAEMVIERVVPQLKLAEEEAGDEAGQRLAIVALGADFDEARELRQLLAGLPGVSEVRQTSFVNGERLELGLLLAGDPLELGEKLHGAVLGGRRLRLEQSEIRRLTLRLEDPGEP